MPYKDGSWGEKAKERNKRRLEYFKEYQRNRKITRLDMGIPEYQRNRKKITQLGMGIPEKLIASVIDRSKELCENCGKKGVLIHHRDGQHENNFLENLMLLCRGCHNFMHKFKGDEALPKTQHWREYKRKHRLQKR